MEKFTGLSVKRSEFAMLDVVMQKEKNLKVSFMVARNTNGEIFSAKGQLTYDHQSSEPFQTILNQLQPYLCKIKKVTEDAYSTIHVKGLKLSGSGDNEGFEILGYQTSDSDGIMKCDSHKIHYEGEEYSWLDEVQEIAESIEDRVFAYLFEGEKAQLSMFDDEKDETTEELEEEGIE